YHQCHFSPPFACAAFPSRRSSDLFLPPRGVLHVHGVAQVHPRQEEHHRQAHHGHPHRDQEQITGGRTVGTGHDLPHHRRHRLHVQRVAARGGRTRGVDPGPVQPVADRGRHP